MGDEMITTAVDDLLAYLRGKDKVAMQDVASVLNVPLETLQAWVDFLVEEKILGIEYKFTRPFIYINEEHTKRKSTLVEPTLVLEDVKKQYIEHARAKQMPEGTILDLWRSHVLESLARKRDYFIEQATRRSATDPEQLWKKYQEQLLARC